MWIDIKRALALVLLLGMLLSLFAGCGSDPEPVDKNVTPEATVPEVVLDPLTEEQKLQDLPTRAPGGGTKEYTVMIYLVGSDLESNNGCATEDMKEILLSGVDTSRVNVIVYTGGARYWQGNVPSDCNVVYQLTRGGWEAVAATETACNMGDPSTFLDFVNYTYQNFPANHYGVIGWDHGGGPIYGYGYDEQFGYDRLYLYEMDAALEASPFAQKKMDFLGFDACLMSSMEVAEMAADYAHYLISSEETEPGCGWDYSFLASMNDTSDTEVIAWSIMYTYEAYMDKYRVTPKYTLSCLDLSQIGNFRSAASKLFDKMATGVTGGDYSAIAQARQKTLYFAVTSESPYDLVDIGDMANRLKSLYGSEVSALQTALDKLVVDQVTNIDGASGVAVYYPYDNKQEYQNAGEVLYPLVTDCTGYENFVAAFTDYWINGEPAANFTEHEVEQPAVVTPTQPATEPSTAPTTPTQPSTPPVTEQVVPAGDLSLTLSADQLANLSTVTYTVFVGDIDRSSGQKVYIPVLEDIPLEPDSSGTVRLPADQKLVVMRTDEEEEGILWPASQVAGSSEYINIDTYLTATLDTVSGKERVYLYFSEGNANRMNIRSVGIMSDSGVVGRGEPDLTNWEYVAKRYTTLFPTCNNAGVLTAYTSWDDSGDEYYSLLSYDEEFWLEQVSMSSRDEEFYVQIILKDTQGNTYASAVAKYSEGADYEVYTENGVTYHVYADHATVVAYDGTTAELTIPEKVGGKRVTEIGTEAFYYNRTITSVVLPASLETVGVRAFANCRNLTSVLFMDAVKTIRNEAFYRSGLITTGLREGVERIEYGAYANTPLAAADIPASVKFLGSGVFADCVNLIGITVATDPNGSSASFKAVNGMLLTADGKELIQVPMSGMARVAVPDGVEVIRSGAVRGSESIREVILPEGLKEIESYAFYDTVNLESLVLPDSLEIIGNSAFGMFGVSVNTASPITTMTIGPNVRHIGYDAFDAFPIGVFVVDGGNDFYRAKNNCLLNKSGTVLIHVPYTYTGALEIPEGVSHLAFHSLNMCDGITALTLPDSVVSMDANVGLPEKLQKLTVGKGLSCWDNIADAAYIDQVQISSGNNHYVLKDNSIYSADMTTLYLYRGTGTSLDVPEGVVTLADTALSPGEASKTLTHLQLPSTVKALTGELFRNLEVLEAVQIHEDNASYASSDGLIYTKNGVSLILCPQGKTGNVSVKIGTSTIWLYAFYGQLAADKVVIPEGVMTIRKGNFVTYRSQPLSVKLPGSLEKIYPDMFWSPGSYTVTCPAGSTAETFARSRGTQVSG